MKNFIIIMILFFITYIPLYSFASDQLRKHLGPSFVVSVVLLTLTGIYAPNIEAFFGIMIVVVLCTVRGRVEAVCRYILLAAIVPQMQWRIGAIGHYIGAIDSAGAIGTAAYVIAKFDRKGSSGATSRRWTVEDYLVLVIFLIMAIGTSGFDNINDTLRTWIMQFFLIVTPYLLFRSAVNSMADFRAVIACFGAAALFMAVFAVYESRLDANVFDIITKHLTGIYVRNIDMRGGLMRASVTMGGPLEFACFMTVGMFAVACSRSFFRNALGYYGSLGVAAMGMLAGQSRGSLVALFVSAIVLSVALRKWGMAAVATVTGVLAWPVLRVVAAASPAVASFMNGGAAAHPGQTDYRNLLLQRGLQVASSHPLTGMRLPQVLVALSDIAQGEGIVDLVNVYLEILLISGAVGLLPFLALTLRSGTRGVLGFKRISDPVMLRARGFTLAAFTVLLLQLSFVSFIGRIPMLFVLTLFGIRLMVQERDAMRSAAKLAGLARSPEPVPAVFDAPDRGLAWVPRLPVIPA